MKVYKFGGASIKDASGIVNLIEIIKKEESNNIYIVVSAMGKTTRILEKAVDEYLSNPAKAKNTIADLFYDHTKICKELFDDDNDIFEIIERLKGEIIRFLDYNKSFKKAFVYDQIICFGEMLSSHIISEAMAYSGVKNLFVDARTIIKTDSNYRSANVEWDATIENIRDILPKDKITITQGFIGSDENNFSTSLGIEGSDYSAAIIAYCINAESVTIWKDVDGILSGDPKYFDDVTLLSHISFREAIEMAYYGATIIHPKTIQPLQHKEIPLHVKNFKQNNSKGTIITKGAAMDPLTPCYILKRNQIFISISTLNFTFIIENNLSSIFGLIAKFQLKANLIQNSAISLSLVIEDVFDNIEPFINSMKHKYKIKYISDVNLYTIRHYNNSDLIIFEQQKNIILKQITQNAAQYVVS